MNRRLEEYPDKVVLESLMEPLGTKRGYIVCKAGEPDILSYSPVGKGCSKDIHDGNKIYK
jgi:hypothetical protein